MKIRNGFVSNSSSSSFIIGWGTVKDLDKLRSYCRKNKISINAKDEEYDYHDYDKTINLYIEPYDIYSLKDGEERRILTGGNETEMLVPRSKIPYNEPIFTVKIHNDEGDGGVFSYDEKTGDMGYDKAKNKNFYSGAQRAIIDLFENTDIVYDHDYIIGAERKG